MATWQATNVLTGTVEGPKYYEIGTIDEIWKVTLPTTLANGDTVLGPTMPAGCYLVSCQVSTASLDSSTGLTFTAGYTSHLADWISTSTVGQGGGVASINVGGPGAISFSATTNTQMLVSITHVATTAVQGVMVLRLSYTANP